MSVYHKPTFSEIFTNYESFIPKSFKFAAIFTLLHRAFKLCSNFEIFHQELNNLKNSLVTESFLLIYVLRNIWIGYMYVKMSFHDHWKTTV